MAGTVQNGGFTRSVSNDMNQSEKRWKEFWSKLEGKKGNSTARELTLTSQTSSGPKEVRGV